MWHASAETKNIGLPHRVGAYTGCPRRGALHLRPAYFRLRIRNLTVAFVQASRARINVAHLRKRTSRRPSVPRRGPHRSKESQELTAPRVSKLGYLGLGVAMVATMSALAWAAQTPGRSTYDGDCSGCHGSQQVLPSLHVPTAALQWEDCVQCHDSADERVTLRGRLPLGHLHGLRGIACVACHEGSMDSAPEGDRVCIQCHGRLNEVATQPARGGPNPHDSHYRGLECTFCHHVHRPSEDFCLQCHEFGYRIP